MTAGVKPVETSVFDAIRREIADEYAQPHEKPWIVGFSGGKDSTLVAHLVVEHLLSVPRSERIRPVHVVANDTLVESPLVIGHVKEGLDEIRRASAAFDLPVVVATTTPSPDQTFWVNLIGRGYPSPNRSFRWCTDRMKILPTSRYVRNQASLAGEVILLLGVRRSESATRAGVVARYDNGARLNAHNDLTGCLVFRPIVDLHTDEVWEFLAANAPPWGGSHRRLIQLYRDAGGGECPVIIRPASDFRRRKPGAHRTSAQRRRSGSVVSRLDCSTFPSAQSCGVLPLRWRAGAALRRPGHEQASA